MRIGIGLLFSAALLAQTATHTVTLKWEDALNPAGTVYTVYRANGACSATPTYTLIASLVAAKFYDDAGVNPGKYCYSVSAVYNTEESDKAVPAIAQVKPFPPNSLNTIIAYLAPREPIMSVTVTVVR